MISYIRSLLKSKGYASSSVYLILGSTLTAVIFLLIDVALTRTVSVTLVGEWKQLLLLVQLFIPVFYFGIPEGFKYLLARNPKRQKFYFANALSVTVLLTILILILNFFGFWNWILVLMGNTNSTEALYSFPLIYFLIMIYTMLQYIAINNYNTQLFFKAVIASSVFQLAILASIFFFYKDSPWLQRYISWIFVALVFGNYLIRSLVLGKGVRFPLRKLKVKKELLRRMLLFGVPIYIAGFIGILTLNIDKLIVSNLGGTTKFAIYAIGAFEVPLIGIISMALAKSLFPKLVEYINSGDEGKAKGVWVDTTKKASFFIYPLILFFLIISEPFILLLFGEDYRDAIPIFQTYLLILIWRNNQYGAIFQAKGKTKWITFYSVITLISNAILSYLLYHQFGMIGVVYATFISIMITQLLILHHENMLGLYFKKVIFNKLNFIFLLGIFATYAYLTNLI